jgi:cobalt/nickel transport system permease protein
MHTETCPLYWELRCRFVVATAWILGIGLLQRLPSLGIAMVAMLLLLPLVGVPLKRVVRRLLFVAPFLVISFFTLLISAKDFDFALLTATRILACLLAVSLVSIDDVRKHLAGFRALRLPETLTSTLFLAQRYVHLVALELIATKNSLASRLFAAPTSLKTMNVYGQIVGGLTIKAIDRSEQIRKAMESRGFQGRIRTDGADPIRKRDLVQSMAAILFLTVIFLAERSF